MGGLVTDDLNNVIFTHQKVFYPAGLSFRWNGYSDVRYLDPAWKSVEFIDFLNLNYLECLEIF